METEAVIADACEPTPAASDTGRARFTTRPCIVYALRGRLVGLWERLRCRLGAGAAVVLGACAGDPEVAPTSSGSTSEPAATTLQDSSGASPAETGMPNDDDADDDDGEVQAKCGDAIVTLGEQCDGENVGGKTCADFGWDEAPGGLRCGADCKLDLASCIACGNGVLDQTTEECDGDQTRGLTCTDLPGFSGGAIQCADDCRLDVSSCISSCGNGTLEGDEACEFDGFDTCDFVFGDGWSGDALCSQCQFLLYNCSFCGDGSAGGWEQCDGSPVDPEGFTWTCEDFFGLGTQGEITCDSTCSLDVSGCMTCGNGFADFGEVCDGFDLGLATCEDFGFSGGTLGCTSDCQSYDASACLK